MRLMIDALKFACEKKDTYPQIGVHGFQNLDYILAFVGHTIIHGIKTIFM